MSLRSVLLQALCYAVFAAFIGYFSSGPPYRHLAADRAVVKLSFSHAGERRQPCRTRTPEELAKLAPNMRVQQDCPRERSDVTVEVEMDGALLLRATGPAGGLRHDLPTTFYRRVEIPAGPHEFRARLADAPGGEFRWRGEAAVNLAPGRVMVIDFAASRGGFLFTPPGGART